MSDPRQEFHDHIRQFQAGLIQDFERDTTIAFQALEILAQLKGGADRGELAAQAGAIRDEWLRLSIHQQKTTRYVRTIALSLGDSGLRTYLYATQYLFLAETYVQFWADVVLFLCDSMREPVRSEWQDARRKLSRQSLHSKLVSLERENIQFIGVLFDRQLRNALAHGQFEIADDGTLTCWTAGDRTQTRSMSLDDLIGKFNNITDLAATAWFLFTSCIDPSFLKAPSNE